MRQFAGVLVLIFVFGVTGCQPSEERSTPQNAISTATTVEPALRSGPAIEVMEKEIELGDIPEDQQHIVAIILLPFIKA